MKTIHFSVADALWVRGEAIAAVQRNAISETRALRTRGASVFLLKGAADREGLARLKRLLWRNDTHVILGWLLPKEINALRPILYDRGNFSLLTDDWWIYPNWSMSRADYLLFRKYHGIAVRLGQSPFLSGGEPPLLLDPRPQNSRYATVAALLRPPLLAISPLLDEIKRRQCARECVSPERLLYFPFAIDQANVPLSGERPIYDFANTGGVCSVWLMRDYYAPSKYSFANLYEDRRRLVVAIAAHAPNPFSFYDWRRGKGGMPYDEYIRKNQQSRFLVASGGLHDTTVPKFLEYACVGTPMIGRALPFDYPWLDDCLFPVDMMHACPATVKPVLERALDAYPLLRENCLNWRDRLLKLYSIDSLLDLLQSQVDGKPVSPQYLKPEAMRRRDQGFRISPGQKPECHDPATIAERNACTLPSAGNPPVTARP